MTSGKEANLTGRSLEDFIESKLLRQRYEYVPNRKFDEAKILGHPVFTKQYFMGLSIYETPFKTDFVIYHPEKWPECLAIESKWQQVAGSVDEKYPYAVANLKERSKFKFIILLDGGGYKRGAVKWLKKQADEKFIGLMTMVEFQTWVNKGNI